MSDRPKGKIAPFDKRKVGLSKKAMKQTDKSVKPVAKDSNKTRRKMIKPARGNIR